MKLLLILCALVLSLHGWCATGIPSHVTVHANGPGHEIIIGWGMITYLSVIVWWAITARNSLNKILKDVLQGIAQY
jgi:hypothetical protein